MPTAQRATCHWTRTAAVAQPKSDSAAAEACSVAPGVAGTAAAADRHERRIAARARAVAQRPVLRWKGAGKCGAQHRVARIAAEAGAAHTRCSHNVADAVATADGVV